MTVFCRKCNFLYADMAQLVEQRIRNAQVVGSSPTISSKTCVNTAFMQVFSFQNPIDKIIYLANKRNAILLKLNK